jgi:membrane associated rhomboid family serine protease
MMHRSRPLGTGLAAEVSGQPGRCPMMALRVAEDESQRVGSGVCVEIAVHMARSGPITMTFPPFSGATRNLILVTLAVFFLFAFLALSAPMVLGRLTLLLSLIPATLLHGQVWQLLSYEFLPTGILGTMFSMLTLWFFGSTLEDRYGSGWLIEFYLLTAAAGGLFAAILAYFGFLRLDAVVSTSGPWAPILAMLVAFGVVSGNESIRFNFIFTMKVKYLVGLYVLYYLAILLLGPDRFGALTCLASALAGFAYMRVAPRRGFLGGAGFSFSERLYAMRNEIYRRKRRNAAKKFEVYMRKQNREVHFDQEGRYVDPDERRDPNDKRWMN